MLQELDNWRNSKSKILKSSSVRGVSDQKPKPLLNLEDSMYAASMNTQMISSPVAENNFNK